MRKESQLTALIIVDMQKGMSPTFCNQKRNNSEAEANIAELLSAWRKRNFPIVHVRHISRTVGSPFWPGQPGAEFQEALQPLSSEHVVEKNVPDAFIHSGLERWLQVRDINQLVVVGVSTNNSVEASARSAGNLGFATKVISDATYTFDKVDYSGVLRKASEVHAMSLANLQGEYAEIVATSEALLIDTQPNKRGL